MTTSDAPEIRVYESLECIHAQLGIPLELLDEMDRCRNTGDKSLPSLREMIQTLKKIQNDLNGAKKAMALIVKKVNPDWKPVVDEITDSLRDDSARNR